MSTANATETVNYVVGDTSLGRILVATTEHGVSAILFGENNDTLIADLSHEFPQAVLTPAGADQGALIERVAALIEQPSASFDLPLDIRGTAFQRSVWKALGDVKGGTTASYKDIATKIGSPEAVRAVARACGANRLAVVIPCHRVIASNGALSGYRWGIDRKKALLVREKA